MGMPTEIFEKIVAGIDIPDRIMVTYAENRILSFGVLSSKRESCTWSPNWLPGLFLVSKTFNRTM